MTKTTKTTKKTSTKKAARPRLPEGSTEVLTSLEENVLRMRYGITETKTAPLGTKATTPELAEMLYAIEARAYEMTGRAEGGAKKKPSPKAKIVSSLKAKS